jgi:hypothetical protein
MMKVKLQARGEAILKIIRIIHPNTKDEPHAVRLFAVLIGKTKSFVQQIRAGTRDLSQLDAEKIRALLKKENRDLSEFVDPGLLCRAETKTKTAAVPASKSVESSGISSGTAETKTSPKKRSRSRKRVASKIPVVHVSGVEPKKARSTVASSVTTTLWHQGTQYLAVLLPIDAKLEQAADVDRLVITVF